MNGGVNPETYQEVINQLRAFTNQVFQQTGDIMMAANACASTMEGDPVAASSINALQKSVSQIQEGVNLINSVISGMNKELEDSMRAVSIGKFDS